MAFEFLLIVTCVAGVSAGTGFFVPVQLVARVGQPSTNQHYLPASGGSSAAVKSIDYNALPQYKYSYDVQDSYSGDSKSQTETRDGDKVNGQYSLVDADGFKRIVRYTSDSLNGFNAIVTRLPIHGGNVVGVALPEKVSTTSSIGLPYVSASAQEIDYEPVVKGAYAVRPIVRAVPVAYLTSKTH